jgi:hypothetical protein
MQELKQNHAKGPNICFWTIQTINKSLRSHIERRADVHVLKDLPRLHCKTKVSYFSNAVFNKNISRFNVSVEDVFGGEVSEPRIDVF